MKLILSKGQRKAGLTGGKIAFSLHARAELTQAEKEALNKYKFHKEILYAKENVSPDHVNYKTWGGIGRNFAAAALNLRISVNDLIQGKTVECKEIGEMLDVEHTIRNSCEALKSMLEAAAGFGGESVIEY